MDCTLCKKPINDYDSRFNHLQIDDNCSAELCEDCIDKIMRMQGEKVAKLFPTSAMKKRFGKNK